MNFILILLTEYLELGIKNNFKLFKILKPKSLSVSTEEPSFMLQID